MIEATKTLWVCDCGKLTKTWVDPSVKMMCPFCNTELKEKKQTYQTKIKSFIELDENTLSTKRALIAKVIRELNQKNIFPNNRELSVITEIPINVVTARVKE